MTAVISQTHTRTQQKKKARQSVSRVLTKLCFEEVVSSMPPAVISQTHNHHRRTPKHKTRQNASATNAEPGHAVVAWRTFVPTTSTSLDSRSSSSAVQVPLPFTMWLGLTPTLQWSMQAVAVLPGILSAMLDHFGPVLQKKQEATRGRDDDAGSGGWLVAMGCKGFESA